MGYTESITSTTTYKEQETEPPSPLWIEDDLHLQPLVEQPKPPPRAVPDKPSERDYAEVLRFMQQAQWDRAVPMLRALQAQHPTVSQVTELLQEATFRADLESQWADKVKARRGLTLPVHISKPILAVLVLGVILISGWLYYKHGQQTNAVLAKQAVALEQAQNALVAGQYREALDRFEQLLAANPADSAARQGQQEALHQLQIATDYQLALDQIAAGDSQQALRLLTHLQEIAPGYRDVDKRIADLKSTIGAPQLFADAEAAFTHGLWITAITNYEHLRRIDSVYAADMATSHLATAYFRAGQQIMAVRPIDNSVIQQAEVYLQKATQLQAKDPELKSESQWLNTYLAGERLLTQQRYEAAIQTLYPLYQARPTYLGGYIRDLLHRAYVTIAEQYVTDQDLTNALVVYQRAVQLGLDNNNLLTQRITALTLLLTPEPTALPTMTPIPVVVAPVIAAPVAPAPVVEATPTTTGYDQYRGWIAFRTSRNGGEDLFLMQADGSNVQPASADVANKVAELYQQQQISRDGSQQLYAQQSAEQGTINLFKGPLGGTVANAAQMLTSFNGTEYDPVWSPDDQWIAFVANHTGNDEIWRMDANGGQPRQLTFNDWQWDKHPSFSPDGQQLVFFSNRTGLRQIWRMAADGSNQINLSNNTFEDWNPVWLR